MRSLSSFVWTLFGATAAVSASDGTKDAPANVVSLTKNTFGDFIKSHDLVLAEFFAPWCGHCKALAPIYEEAATELKAKNIPLVKVDCTEEEELCGDQNIGMFPTLKVFRGPDSIKPYNGGRQTESLVSYMIKQSLPAVTTVNEENLEDVKTMDKIVVIGYFSSDDKAANETFTSLAEAYRDNYVFAATSNPAVAKAEGASQPSVALYKDFDDKKVLYDGEFKKDAILNWVKTSSTPLVGELGPENYADYTTAGIPLAYIFAETKEEREKFAEEFKPIAKKHKRAINIVTLDASKFGAHAGNVNLNPEKFPSFAIQDTTKNAKYPYDQSKEINAKDVGKFIQSVLDGKVDPSVKSEPVPETQEGPVTVVVGHTYQDLVVNNDKDVLIEFYAPWCGHCKSLAPKYEELAGLYAGVPTLSSQVTIAKIDATANDFPEEIQGFPTIKLFPAGAKDSPVEYSGDRTVADLANFVKANGKHKADGLAAKEESQEAASASSTPSASSDTSTGTATPTGEKADHDEL